MIPKDGFNYIEYLKRRKFIGNLLDADYPIEGLLVPIEVALSECAYWSNQDLSRKELLTVLRQANVFVGSRDELQDAGARQSAIYTDKNNRLREICDLLDISTNRIQIVSGTHSIVGRSGTIEPDGTVFVRARSRRHLSGIKRRLSFCKLTLAELTEARFGLPESLSDKQTQTLRTIIGLKKRPSLTEPPKLSLEWGEGQPNVDHNDRSSAAMGPSPALFPEGGLHGLQLPSAAT